jgi:hypothetical protein
MNMQNIDNHLPTGAVGGRVSSPKFRASLQRSEEFTGLKEDTSRFYALKLVKQAGKDAGFTSELIELLEYYLIRTEEIDWTSGNKPICYQAVTTTAQDLDITERQVRNRESALNSLGALTWEDSGNFKRYGVRDNQSREILYAFGVDLSPLASLIPELERRVEEKKALKALWNEHKRKISALRGRIRTLLAEASLYGDMEEFVLSMQEEYEAISYSIRTYHALDHLKALQERHSLLCHALLEALEGRSKEHEDMKMSHDTSATDETDCRQIHSTTLKQSDKSDYSNRTGTSLRKGVAEPPCPNPEVTEGGEASSLKKGRDFSEDLSKVTWKMMLGTCSERFREHIPIHERPLSWEDLVEAAHSLLPELGIHKSAWFDACGVMGRMGAAICVMIIDQKSQGADCAIRNPGGYLREMTARAKTGELNLQASVFGLLKRGEESTDA